MTKKRLAAAKVAAEAEASSEKASQIASAALKRRKATAAAAKPAAKAYNVFLRGGHNLINSPGKGGRSVEAPLGEEVESGNPWNASSWCILINKYV